MSGKYWNAMHSWSYGCSPGTRSECASCWASALIHKWERNPAMGLVRGHLTTPSGLWSGAVHLLEHKPFTLRGRAKVIACNWLGDLFYHRVPMETVFTALDEVYANIRDRGGAGSPPHAYLFLTHRPSNMIRLVEAWVAARWRGNALQDIEARNAFMRCVWWGATVTRQSMLAAAHEIVALPGRHWLSVEPIETQLRLGEHAARIDWVAAGTSTTDPALQHDTHVTMLRALVGECHERGLPIWVKQCGAFEPTMIEREMPAPLRLAYDGGVAAPPPAQQPDLEYTCPPCWERC